MTNFTDALGTALALVFGFDEALTEIVALSLRVSLSAVAIAAAIGLPVGAVLALYRFRGRFFLVVSMNALMGLPPVVVGLIGMDWIRGRRSAERRAG